MGDDNKPLTDSEKLDIICNSVKNLTQNYNDLTKKVDNMQSKFDLKIESLKQEMNLKENKYIQNSGVSLSSVNVGESNDYSDSTPSNANKKRKTIGATYKIKYSNQENTSNEVNVPRRKKTIIRGDQEETGLKTAGRVFELYIGGVAQDESDEKIKSYFQHKKVKILELTKITTRIPNSNAFKAIIPKEDVHIIYNSQEKWPKNIILNKYTPPNLNKIYNNKYNMNFGRTYYSNPSVANNEAFEDESYDEVMNVYTDK